MKTKFILPFIMLNLISGVGSLVMFWYLNWDPVWIGTFLTTLPLPFFLMAIAGALGITRTSKNLPFIQLISFIGVAIVVYLLYLRGGPSQTYEYIAAAIAILGTLSYQWYIHIFSPYKRTKSAAIVKGQSLPELPLARLDGSSVSSASFEGEKTLLVFFRANWCPFCMNQLKEIAAQADNLNRAGVQVKYISNQGIDNSKKLAKDLNLPSSYEILQDHELKAAKKLGIEDIDGSPVGMSGYPADTIMATVVGLDENGIVIFGDETDNYRRRPHPDTFLNVFES